MSEKLTFELLAKKSNDHINHIIFSSSDVEDLLFKLSGFYGGLLTVLKENKLVK